MMGMQGLLGNVVPTSVCSALLYSCRLKPSYLQDDAVIFMIPLLSHFLAFGVTKSDPQGLLKVIKENFGRTGMVESCFTESPSLFGTF